MTEFAFKNCRILEKISGEFTNEKGEPQAYYQLRFRDLDSQDYRASMSCDEQVFCSCEEGDNCSIVFMLRPYGKTIKPRIVDVVSL